MSGEGSEHLICVRFALFVVFKNQHGCAFCEVFKIRLNMVIWQYECSSHLPDLIDSGRARLRSGWGIPLG